MNFFWSCVNEWQEHGVLQVLPCITILYETDPWWDKEWCNKDNSRRVLRQCSVQVSFLTHSATLDVEILAP